MRRPQQRQGSNHDEDDEGSTATAHGVHRAPPLSSRRLRSPRPVRNVYPVSSSNVVRARRSLCKSNFVATGRWSCVPGRVVVQGPCACGAIRAGPIAGGWAASKAGLFGMRLPRNPAARSVAKTWPPQCPRVPRLGDRHRRTPP